MSCDGLPGVDWYHGDTSAMTMRLALQAVVIGLTLKLTIPEFVEIQRLRGRELREHLDLPRSCDPEMAAMRTSPRGRVTVLVMCGEREDAHADARTSLPSLSRPIVGGAEQPR